MHRILYAVAVLAAFLYLGYSLDTLAVYGGAGVGVVLLGLIVEASLSRVSARRALLALAGGAIGAIAVVAVLYILGASGAGVTRVMALSLLSFTAYVFASTGYFHGDALRGAPVTVAASAAAKPVDDDVIPVGGKILDTSVVIDGRILDIAKTRFLDAALIIPRFVLKELQLISDSSDSMKRIRGRRGLDVLNELKKSKDIVIRMADEDFPDIKEVDLKLLKLAGLHNAKIVTNDFNLNKVAEFQNIVVLNINDLANALKPIYLPGESMKVAIVKKGKDPTQGIAYLEDGTMIVIDNGARRIGEEVSVVVTSAFQTSAGRMIFCKIEGQTDRGGGGGNRGGDRGDGRGGQDGRGRSEMDEMMEEKG